MWSAEQRRRAGGSRRGLSEGRSPEFRSRALSDATHREEVLLGCPALRAAQGSRRSRPRSLWWLFLWLLSFCHQKESTPARQARKPAVEKTTPHHDATSPSLPLAQHIPQP